MSKVKSAITNKLWDLDFGMRKAAFDDKERSKTRLVFALVLAACFIGCFIGLFIYKALTRSLISQTILPPGTGQSVKYSDFAKVMRNKDVNESVNCLPGAKVLWSEMIVIEGESWEIAQEKIIAQAVNDSSRGCANFTVSPYTIPNFRYDSCITVIELTANMISMNYISATSLITSYQELDYTMYDDMFDTWLATANEIYVSRKVNLRTLDDLVLGGILDIYNTTEYDKYTNESNEYTDDLLFDDVLNGGEAFYQALYFDEETFKRYFDLAQVKKCEYQEKQGWLDVLSYAWNTTSTFFGGLLVVSALLFTLVKKIQHRKDPKEEDKPSDVEMKKTDV